MSDTETETPATPETTEAAAATETTTEQATTTEAAPEVVYDLKLPEGSSLDPAVLERTAADARTQGLTNEQAQAVVNLLSETAKAQADAVLAAYQPGGAAYAKLVDGWKQEALADESLGKTPEERAATIQRGHGVLQKYAERHPEAADAMTGFLESTGLGNHPAAVRLFAWLGEAMAETPLVKGDPSPPSKPQSIAKALYPTMA